MTRYPHLDLGSVIALCPTRLAARRVSKFAGPEFNRAEAEGLTVEQADRIAVRLGKHPAEIWPVWTSLNEAEMQRDCEDCGDAFVPTMNRGKLQRFCSSPCVKRAWARRRYATDPSFAEDRRRRARAYYEENGDYVRGRVRRYERDVRKYTRSRKEEAA